MPAPPRPLYRSPTIEARAEVVARLVTIGVVRDAAHLAEVIEKLWPEDAEAAAALLDPAIAGMHPARVVGVYAAAAELRYQKTLLELSDPVRTRGLVVVTPLPPHVLEPLLQAASARFVVPDGHPVPRLLREAQVPLIQGRRALGLALTDAKGLVFEAVRSSDHLLVDPDVFDVVSPLLGGGRLYVHLRGHAHPRDIALPPITVTFL